MRFIITLLMVTFFIKSADAGAIRDRLRERFQNRDTTPTSKLHETKYIYHNGLKRRYLIHTPSNKNSTEKLPVVIALHGGGGNAENAIKMMGFSQLANIENFIAVYPEGTGRREHKLLTWNATHCCGYAMTNKIDDVGYISALIDKIIAEDNADPRRIFVTGMSNGGMMTHKLGIQLSHKIKGIAPVVSGLFGTENQPDNPVSAIIINGLLDKSIPIHGGHGEGKGRKAWDGTPLKPSFYQYEFWASANRCTINTKTESLTEKVDQIVADCPNSQKVHYYLVKDNSHAWPGGERGSRLGDKPSQSFNATQKIWSFFKSL